MTMLFGQPCDSPSFFELALTALHEGKEVKDRALSENFQEDDRVSKRRQEAFKHSFHPLIREFSRREGGPFDSGELFKNGVRAYFETFVQWDRYPHFIRGELNNNNFLSDEEKLEATGGRLVRLMNLNGLFGVFMWAEEAGVLQRVEPFRPLARILKGLSRDKPDRKPFNSWLQKYLKKAPKDDVEVVVQGVLDVLSENRKAQAYQPTWATSFDALKPYLEDGPTRWSQVLGVDHREEPSQWVVLLTYPASAVKGPLVRPSQLDAGLYPRHHPLRAAIPVRKGGHPMDLRYEPPAQRLLPEFIHDQIDHDISHFRFAGNLVLQTDLAPVAKDILRERKCHRDLLVRDYPEYYERSASTPGPEIV